MLLELDDVKREASSLLNQERRSELGQFLTSEGIASFMASLFGKQKSKNIHVLDAGAGVGSLSIALFERILKQSAQVDKVELTAYEIDQILLRYLHENISLYKKRFQNEGKILKLNIVEQDFIKSVVCDSDFGDPTVSHAILNPPYKKINSQSEHRKLLSKAGIETVNLYSAFVSLSIKMLKKNGELVAIIPRSFCNGNYFKSFRKNLIESTAIKHLHLFQTRNDAFKDDHVLQENIIIHLKKGVPQGRVKVSKCTNHKFDNYSEHIYAFKSIVKPSDSEYFIHLPNPEVDRLESSEAISFKLDDLGLNVSTGPVVDFRSKEFIYPLPNKDTVPLLYPTHFNGKEISWPKSGKKPNAILLNEITKKMLYPSGFYTIVKRFSTNEEKQRIVARVINPTKLQSSFIGIENHINVFHSKKEGISKDLAYGLAAYLNSTLVDKYFRTFNGHTQVNATDLKQMTYPSLTTLTTLGKWAKKIKSFDPKLIDKKILQFL